MGARRERLDGRIATQKITRVKNKARKGKARVRKAARDAAKATRLAAK